MPAILISLLGLIGTLIQKGAAAYEDAQKKHDDLVAAVESGLAEAQAALAKMKSDHATSMAATEAQIEALRQQQLSDAKLREVSTLEQGDAAKVAEESSVPDSSSSR